MEVLKSAGPKGTAGIGERRLLRGVTILQTALTLALLVGAGLLFHDGENRAGVLGLQHGANFDDERDRGARQVDVGSFHRQALERVAAIPGVQYAAFVWGVPLTGNNWPATFEMRASHRQ